MSDQERFEARFEAAYERYLDAAPVTVDPRALARAITAASPRTGARGFLTLGTTFRLVLIAALLAAAALGIGLAAGQILTPHLGCATLPAPTTTSGSATASAGESGASAAEFLWSATGPADDPMRFATSISGIAGGGPVAVDRACRAWVADTGNDRFAIFNPDGSFVEYWGEPGKGDGQFNMRSTGNDGFGAVAFAPDGTFYVLDIGNDRIQHFDSQRGFLGSWGGRGTDPGHYSDPLGIAVDANGVVYVLDDDRDVVETYDATGKVLGSFSPGFAGRASNGMALDAQGDIYVTACCSLANEVRKFAPDGTLLAEIGSFGTGYDPQMTAVAIDASGRVFTAQSGSQQQGNWIRVYDQDRTLLTGFGSEGYGDGQFGLGWILGLALDGQGGLYATDGSGNRLEKFQLLPPIAP